MVQFVCGNDIDLNDRNVVVLVNGIPPSKWKQDVTSYLPRGNALFIDTVQNKKGEDNSCDFLKDGSLAGMKIVVAPLGMEDYHDCPWRQRKDLVEFTLPEDAEFLDRCFRSKTRSQVTTHPSGLIETMNAKDPDQAFAFNFPSRAKFDSMLDQECRARVEQTHNKTPAVAKAGIAEDSMPYNKENNSKKRKAATIRNHTGKRKSVNPQQDKISSKQGFQGPDDIVELIGVSLALWNDPGLVPAGNYEFFKVANGYLEMIYGKTDMNISLEDTLQAQGRSSSDARTFSALDLHASTEDAFGVASYEYLDRRYWRARKYSPGEALGEQDCIFLLEKILLDCHVLHSMKYILKCNESCAQDARGGRAAFPLRSLTFPDDRTELMEWFLGHIKDLSTKKRPWICAGNVPMHSENYVVLAGASVTDWDKDVLPAGNTKLLSISKEYARKATSGGQTLAGHILNDPRVARSMKFLIPSETTSKLGKKKWTNSKFLVYSYTSNEDQIVLRKKLKSSMNTLINNLETSSDSTYTDKVKIPQAENRKTPTDSSNQYVALLNKITRFEGSCLANFATLAKSRELMICLKDLENAQGQKEKNAWAKEWAARLEDGDPVAMDQNDARHALLLFWKTVCNMGMTKDAQIKEGQESTLRSIATILQRIGHTCFPMDRANILYNFPDPVSSRKGYHWYAEEDVEVMIREEAIKGKEEACPTIHWQYLVIIRSGVLYPVGRTILEPFLEPTISSSCQKDPLKVILRDQSQLTVPPVYGREAIAHFKSASPGPGSLPGFRLPIIGKTIVHSPLASSATRSPLPSFGELVRSPSDSLGISPLSPLGRAGRSDSANPPEFDENSAAETLRHISSDGLSNSEHWIQEMLQEE